MLTTGTENRKNMNMKRDKSQCSERRRNANGEHKGNLWGVSSSTGVIIDSRDTNVRCSLN